MAHSHLWNDLPFEERKRLHPWVMEDHILHLEQTRAMIVSAHEGLLQTLDAQIGNLRRDLLHEVVGQANEKRAIALNIRVAEFAKTMRCNCDLDAWEPEPSTGHSHVCRIHQAAIAA